MRLIVERGKNKFYNLKDLLHKKHKSVSKITELNTEIKIK